MTLAAIATKKRAGTADACVGPVVRGELLRRRKTFEPFFDNEGRDAAGTGGVIRLGIVSATGPLVIHILEPLRT